MITYEEKLLWVKSLQVGDIIENCRYISQKIVKITDCVHGNEVYDRDLMLEDGTMCSAMNCCGPYENKIN